MENAVILYGNYDNTSYDSAIKAYGNALVVRINNLSNLIYSFGGYVIGFTSNNIDYFHFVKADFKNFSDSDTFEGGFYSLNDWLEYWAGNLNISDIRKFEYANFIRVKNGDMIVIEKQKVSPDSDNYNFVEKYTYNWNVNEVSLPFMEKIYIPANATKEEISYPTEITASNFFINSKPILNLVSSKNRTEIAKLLKYSAYCIHHINQSIFSLFNDLEHKNLINTQNVYWSNPFTNYSSLGELDLLNITQDFYLEVLNFYVSGFRNKVKIKEAIGDKKFYYLTLFMSVKSLTTLTSKIKLTILHSATTEMSSVLEKDDTENLIVRISSSFDEQKLDRIDEFLEGLVRPETLIERNASKVTLYQYIYDRMSTSWNFTKGITQLSNWIVNTKFKPTDTKGAFVQAIYVLWQFSKYNPYKEDGSLKPNAIGFKKLDNSSNPKISYNIVGNNDGKLFYYSHESASEEVSNTVDNSYNFYFEEVFPDASPLTIPYSVEKSIGLYLNMMNFKFSSNRISVFQKYQAFYSTHGGISQSKEALYGTYDIFQPVSLLNTNIESSVPILTTTGNSSEINGLTINSFIPMFVLKYYDDSNDRSNTETMIGYTIDGVLTFSGIGNLTKLRHLRWAALGAEEIGLFTKQGLRVVLGGVEFSSGVVGYLANFIECNANDEFCKNFKNFVMAFQLATLSLTAADGLATLAMRQSARGMVKATGKTAAEEIIAEIKNRLTAMNGNNSSPETINQLSRHIYMFSGVPLSLSLIRAILSKIKNAFKGKPWNIHPSYTDAFLEDYIRLCRSELNLTDDTIINLVVIANKPGKDGIKFIDTTELIKQTEFHVKEILKRGFTAGFSDLAKYKQFSNAFKNRLFQNFYDLEDAGFGNLAQHFDDAEFVVQGSAARTWKVGDPEPPSGIAKPREPDDIDAGILIDETDYNSFLDEMETIIDDLNDAEKFKNSSDYQTLKDGLKKSQDMFRYELLEKIPVGNSTFLDKIRDATKSYTNFDRSKINLAIIKKGGKYDGKPNVPFKF